MATKSKTRKESEKSEGTQNGNASKIAAQLVSFVSVWWDQLYNPLTGEYESGPNSARKQSFNNPMSDLWASNGKPPKNPAQGVVSLLCRGWDIAQGVVECEKITTKADKQRCVKQRKQQIELWEAAAAENPVYAVVASHAKALWFPNGKAVEPTHKANMCFRRGYALPAVVAVMNYGEAVVSDFQIAISEVEYADDLTRTLAHVRENLKDAGRSKYSPVEYVLLAQKIVEAFGSEADLVRQGVKRGTAQKAFAIAKLDAMFASVRLVERLTMDAPELPEGEKQYPHKDDGYIPFGPLDKERLRTLANGKKDGTPTASDASEVEAYIGEAMKGGNNANKGMKRDKQDAIATTHKSLLVRKIVKALHDNDSGFFTGPLTTQAEKIDSMAKDAKLL